jgi:hypothetical protein
MPDLQSLCDAGQRALIATDYLAAEEVLAQAESLAWNAQDWDSLSRLYMPLQEARRQRRQRCGEGMIDLNVSASDPDLALKIVLEYPHGQLLVSAAGSIAPAMEVRRLAREHSLYVETFLGANYIVNRSDDDDVDVIIVIVPTADTTLPPDEELPLNMLLPRLPASAIVFREDEVDAAPQIGTDTTYARTMALWERLHTPFLAHAEATADPVQRMAAFRKTIEVDYACELAHQHLSKVAHQLARKK